MDNLLKLFPFINELSNSSSKLFIDQTYYRQFKAKEKIISKGEIVSGAYLVKQGAIRAFGIDSNGKETTFFTANKGEACILAMNSIFNDLRYPANLQSQSLTTIAFIPASILKELFKKEFSLQQFFFNNLAKGLFELTNNIEGVTSLSLAERLANFLIKQTSHKDGLSLSHQDIASQIGSSREVISRKLKILEKKGAIKISRKKLQILNADLLIK